MGSPPGTLSTLDIKKIGIGAVLAILGALAAYVTTTVVPALEEAGTPAALIVAAIVPIAINAIRKWISDTRERKDDES